MTSRVAVPLGRYIQETRFSFIVKLLAAIYSLLVINRVHNTCMHNKIICNIIMMIFNSARKYHRRKLVKTVVQISQAFTSW